MCVLIVVLDIEFKFVCRCVFYITKEIMVNVAPFIVESFNVMCGFRNHKSKAGAPK